MLGVLARAHRVVTFGWAVVAAGAGLGFVARDLLGLPGGVVALAWIGGAALGGASVAWLPFRGDGDDRGAEPGNRRTGERGQATVEWIALLLLVALAIGGAAVVRLPVDGWSYGGFLAHHWVCAARGGCADGDAGLARAYGPRVAELVRAHAPGLVYEPGERELPVDWRRCRRRRCAEGPDRRDLDVHRSDSGEAATVFTHVLRRGRRAYLQYWLYYPDSNTTVAGSDKAWALAWLVPRLAGVVRRTPRYPGFHLDDWEGYVVRLDPDGSVWARASAHGHWQTCKQKDCAGDWIGTTGWTRVSRGSHAGHIPLRTELRRRGRPLATPRDAFPRGPPVRRVQTPQLPGRDLHERTTTGDGLRLIPLETLDTRRYRSRADEADPPWTKEVYEDPDSDES